MARITVVTDAWHPQVNGVVRSLENTISEMEKMGHEIMLVTPDRFRNVPLPSYPEIRIALTRYSTVARAFDVFQPSSSTLPPKARSASMPGAGACRARCRSRPATTPAFPNMSRRGCRFRKACSTGLVRWFHNAGNVCMVATQSLEQELSARGFRNLMRWTRGIDQSLYAPRPLEDRPFGLPRPLFMQVGRVAVEKNIPAFLDLDLPGSKIVIGDGPDREKLQRAHPDVLFTGAKFGTELAEAYAQADVFVFPSKTDTFGNVILEALASGVPVAAYPVTGPADILGGHEEAGALDEDLRSACLRALGASRAGARKLAESFTWEAATKQFLNNVMQANGIGAGEPVLVPVQTEAGKA